MLAGKIRLIRFGRTGVSSGIVPFVTFEGPEGCGKTTQVALVAEKLRALGYPAVETREPGGTPIGGRIREILMDVANTNLDPVAEWLLYEADRRQHVIETIRPALASSSFVLCDRYSDSTEAYQQAGRGIEATAVRFVDDIARDRLAPDLTLVFDVDPATGLARARRRDGRDGRFEAADMAFHERVRAAYFEIARREGERVRIVKADAPPEAVFETAWKILAERFGIAVEA
jgi:dTMP kinase